MTKEEIVISYLKILNEKNKIPAYSDFIVKGISKDKIKYHYGNIISLHEYMTENHSNEIESVVLTEHSVFSHVKTSQLKDDLKKYKKFVITTVVSDKQVNILFYQSIKSYCEKNNAKLICIPAQDSVSRRAGISYSFAPILRDESFIFEDTRLNENLFISSIKLSAKHIKPITGLSRIGQRNGSYIFASPKQFLEYVISSVEEDCIPHAIMTTGALTVNDYQNERYMSDRTSYIAENDHICGAIVVEIENKKKYHFRQIQSDENGSFVDLSKQYSSDGSVIGIESTLVLGDLHAGEHDENAIKSTLKLIRDLNIKDIVVHDSFSGYSISHYDVNSPHKKALKAMNNQHSFHDEIKVGVSLLNKFLSEISGNIYRVMGNHDEWFNRYLERAGYINDPVNHYDALEYAKLYLDGEEPLKHAYSKFMRTDDFNRIVFLRREDSYKVGGIELAQHGDLGLNGARGSLAGAERAYGDCVIGHNHSAAIFRGVFRVGTLTRMKLGYNVGPSNWTATNCLVYSNGSRQLVSFIGGKYTI